jgi:hemolysin III
VLYHLPGFYEPFSAISHLFGAVLFSFLGVFLLRRGRGDRTRLIVLGVFSASCVVLLALSGVYHMVVRGRTAHAVIGRLDHGAIFVLIAGSITPVHGILFRGFWRWAPLILIWSAAIAGIALKTIFFDSLPEWQGLTLYLAFGWLGAISVGLLWRRYGFASVRLLLLGGVIYSVGSVMDLNRWPALAPGIVGAHELFHLMILMAIGCHWFFTWQIANGRLPAYARGSRVVSGQRPVVSGALPGEGPFCHLGSPLLLERD